MKQVLKTTLFICLLTAAAFSCGLPGGAKSQKVNSSSPAMPADDPGCRSAVSRAASLFASGKNVQSAQLLQDWSCKCGHNAQLHLLLSTILVRTSNIPEATRQAALAVSIAPESEAAHLQYGLVLSSAGDAMKSSREFERVIELDPGSYEAWSSLSNIYGMLHEDEKASSAATKAADLEPSTTTVRLRTLKNLERSGKTNEAAAELKVLLANGEYGPEFMQQLATEALTIGANQEAIEASAKVAEAYPRALNPLKTMALAQYCNQDYAGCLQTAEKMLTLQSNQDDAMALQGLAMIKLGRAQEAEKNLQAEIVRQPELPLALLAVGTLQLSRGDFGAASESLRHCLDNDPLLSKSAEICYTLAQALEKQGDQENSLQYYRQSLSHGLSGADALQARQAVKRLQSTP